MAVSKAKKKVTKKKVAKKKAAPKTAPKAAPAKASAAKPKKIAEKATFATTVKRAAKSVVSKVKSMTKAKTEKTPTAYKIKPGDAAPDVKVPATSGRELSMKDFKGKSVVLYFYPKDNTPGCTLEGHDFRRLHKEFQAAGCEILGVSKDSVRSHEGFKSKCGFPFELLSDESGALCKAFDVIQMKSLYGRKFEGIERSTFVIGKDGKIQREWRKVKVGGHADEVLAFVKEQA